MTCWRDGWAALGLAVIVARSIQELQKSIWASNSSSCFWMVNCDRSDSYYIKHIVIVPNIYSIYHFWNVWMCFPEKCFRIFRCCRNMQNKSFLPWLKNIIGWLVVYLPLWKIWKSVGMIIPNISQYNGKIKNHVPNHQTDWLVVLKCFKWS